MKLFAALFGGVGALAIVWSSAPRTPVWSVVIGGDVAGYLSPCGCTSPMTGGIKRWVSVVRATGNPRTTLVIENGGMSAGNQRQDVLKAEALAMALDSVGVAALNLTSSEVGLGVGELVQVNELAGNSLISGSVTSVPDLPIQPFKRKGPFLVGGLVQEPARLAVLGGLSVETTAGAKRLADEAKRQHAVPILMLEGDENQATALARAVPSLGMIVFQRAGGPPSQQKVVGRTVLVTPGDRGKALVRLSFSEGRFVGYSEIPLEPSVKDDPTASKIYANYLGRVDSENLLALVSRKETAHYSGSAKCESCHSTSYHIWEKSDHSHALKTLEAQGHGHDPECVTCHVTGLRSVSGFRDRTSTGLLANVGCESCHGPGDEHSLNPSTFKLPKIGAKSCAPCHTAENSPGFDFLTFWPKIRHS